MTEEEIKKYMGFIPDLDTKFKSVIAGNLA